MTNRIGDTIRLLLILLATCLLTGCLTESLLQKNTYREYVVSVLLTEDKKTLAFLGKYHYIFETPDILIKTFESSFYPSVQASLGKFNVDINGRITGRLRLLLGSKAPQDHKAAAAASGYNCKTLPSGTELCSVRLELQGTRYDAGNIPVASSHKLKRTHIVSVESSDGIGAKMLLTPVTVAADGAYFIAKSPLIVPSLPSLVFITVLCTDGEKCK